ncbi:hypothetical protein AAMO2058_001566800 [Amorphochlora amoebiformis]
MQSSGVKGREMPLLRGWNLIITIGITVLYLLLGAAVFYALEHPYAVDSRRQFQSDKNDLFAKANFSDAQIPFVEELMTKAAQERYSPYVSAWSEEKSTEIWSYGESLYFTLVTVSTVGFGDMTPQTGGGKAFLIIYTLFGIPLVILILTLCFAGLMMAENDWNYFDGLYFTWTTLTTIGFGDLTIENNNYFSASLCLIILLVISFAAGSAFIAMLNRILHFENLIKKPMKKARPGSRMPLNDEIEGIEISEMKDVALDEVSETKS